MELRVRRWNNLWYPVYDDVPCDATIEVPEKLADEYRERTIRFWNMSDAIEAQVHGTT